MCGKSEAGLGGTRTGFNYRDPGLGKQGDSQGRFGASPSRRWLVPNLFPEYSISKHGNSAPLRLKTTP